MSSRISPGGTIDLAAERVAVEKLRVKWAEEVRKKRVILDAKTTPGPDYWKPEALARARYVAACNILEVLES